MNAPYRVRYVDRARAKVVDEIQDGTGEDTVRATIAAQGHIVLEVREVAWPNVDLRKTGFDVAWWCRELRTLLVAGMTVVEAIETLQVQRGTDSAASLNSDLLARLRQGRSLSAAMRDVTSFPDVLVASVMASERTGALVTALDDFLRYDEMLLQLRRKAVSAAIYPSVVMTLGAAITVFLLVFVVPRYSQMYRGFRSDVSGATHGLIMLGNTLSDHRALVLAILAAMLAIVTWAWHSGRLIAVLRSTAASIGPLQRQWDHFRRAKLFHSLALMFKGGHTLDEALEVCSGLNLGPSIADGISTARAALSRGRAPALAFRAGQLTDVTAERLLSVADRTGGFAEVLQTIADRHAVEFSTFVERATRLVEPILLLVVALVVGGIVVMMYMPIFDIASGIR